jgi:hypothetical protein
LVIDHVSGASPEMRGAEGGTRTRTPEGTGT